MREVLLTSVVGHHICNGLQGWLQLRLNLDVDSPGMCPLSNCPASKGSWSLLFVHPYCTPASMLGPSSYPQLVPEQPQLGPGPAQLGATLSSCLVRGAEEQEVSAHPPSFSWNQAFRGRGGDSGKLTRGERIWLCLAGFPDPWPFLGMPLTSAAPLMGRTALPGARPAPWRPPNDSLAGKSGSPGLLPASPCPSSSNSPPRQAWALRSLTPGDP